MYVSASNDYVYLSKTGKKYKWDANDAFFIRGQKVSQEAFEAALSDGDKLTVDYKTAADNVSTWNITVDVTKSANTGFTNPKADVRFDGFNYDLSGKGQAGNTVKVYRGNDLMGTTTVNSDGTWTLRAVNLTQDAANEFEAYQYAPGKDGFKGTNAESTTPAKRTIFEGAFASTEITLKDQGDAGLSVNDTLEFSFLNNDKAFGHELKEDLEGTITVHDNLSRKAVYNVEYVNKNTLKVVKVVSSEDGYNPNSATTIESTTGVVNQDELAYNVAVSKAKGTTTITKATGVIKNGSVVFKNAAGTVVNNVAIEVGGTVALTSEFSNTTSNNIVLAQNAATYTVVDNKTGATVVATQNIGPAAAAGVTVLAGKTVALGAVSISSLPVGSYTVLVNTAGSVNGTATTFQSQITVTVSPLQADINAAQAVINQISALGTSPTKVAVQAARTAYTGLSGTQQPLVTNYAALQAFEADIQAGITLKADINTAATNKQVKDARKAYTDLGALGKLEVDNLATLTATEGVLVASKSALANEITAATALYAAQKARLDTFSAAEASLINGGSVLNAFDTYLTAVGTLNTAISAAKAPTFDVEADAVTAAQIDAAKGTLNTAVTTLGTAKTAFDTNPEVIALKK